MKENNIIRNSLISLVLMQFSFLTTRAQDAASYFHSGANFFINGKSAEAKQELQAGLSRYPNDPKLSSLLREIKEEEQKNQQEQNKQEKEKEKQKQDQQKKEQEQRQKEQQQKEQQQREQEQKEQQKAQNQTKEQEGKESKDGKKPEERAATEKKLKAMNLSEEKARMILDAMKNSEIQYLQQKRREKTKKTDRNLPDW